MPNSKYSSLQLSLERKTEVRRSPGRGHIFWLKNLRYCYNLIPCQLLYYNLWRWRNLVILFKTKLLLALLYWLIFLLTSFVASIVFVWFVYLLGQHISLFSVGFPLWKSHGCTRFHSHCLYLVFQRQTNSRCFILYDQRGFSCWINRCDQNGDYSIWW